jgi:hypothetical protein
MILRMFLIFAFTVCIADAHAEWIKYPSSYKLDDGTKVEWYYNDNYRIVSSGKIFKTRSSVKKHLVGDNLEIEILKSYSRKQSVNRFIYSSEVHTYSVFCNLTPSHPHVRDSVELFKYEKPLPGVKAIARWAFPTLEYNALGPFAFDSIHQPIVYDLCERFGTDFKAEMYLLNESYDLEKRLNYKEFREK